MARLQPSMFPDIEGPDFIRSDDVAEVAATVLRQHGKAGGVPRLFDVAKAVRDGELQVCWLINAKPYDPLTEKLEHDTAGKCIKVPRLWHDLTGYHIAIWIRSFFWDSWSPEQREAAILHELLHVEVGRDKDEQLKVKIRKHDVEAFVDVVRLYGPFEGESAAFIRAATIKPAGDAGE